MADSSANASGYRDESPSDSLFKRTFKYYKRRDHDPDVSRVLDLRHCDEHDNGLIRSPFVPHEMPSEQALELLGMRPVADWTITTLAHRPGLIMLNDIFKPESHLVWMQRALLNYAEAPGFTNVLLHFPNVTQVYKNHGKQLRWSTLGLHYDWETKVYPEKGEPLPSELSTLANMLSCSCGFGSMQADAAIINYYLRKSSLAPHVDRSERDMEAPLISISFGQKAIYLAGGLTRDDPIDAFYLHSGDALIMYGGQRLIYHGVPRIIKSQVFDGAVNDQSIIDDQILSYANENRINFTIRQVDKHLQ